MRLFDASHHDDAELLERHVLAPSDEVADAALQRFRFAHPMLILVTDNVLEVFRARLRGDPSETEQSLAAVRPRLRTRLDRQKHLRPGQSKLESGIRQWGTFKTHPLRRRTSYTLATIVMIIMAFVIGWNKGLLPAGRPERGSVSEYVTGNGQRANITLTDGTMIALDVASRLEVPADYSAGNRVVRLRGAALFTVVHHGGRPFTVMAGRITAQVLGTSFVVRHYATDTMTTVTVQTGKVAIRSTVLTADQAVEVDRLGVAHVHVADPAQWSFATGILRLNSVPFSAAIVDLNRWYDVDIRLGDLALGPRRLTGELATGSAAEIQDILEGTFGVRVVRDGRVLTLYRR